MDQQKISFKELIADEDQSKIDEINYFLKCSECKEMMFDPKTCLQCSKPGCEKCIKKTCGHPASISRHFKIILDSLVLKCKFFKLGCNAEIKFWDLISHNKKCEFAKIELNKVVSLKTKYDSLYSLTDHINKTDKTHQLNLDSYTLKCLKCQVIYNDKVKFTDHLKDCSNKALGSSNNSKEILLSEFQKNLQLLNKSSYEYWKQTNLEAIQSLKIKNKEFEASVKNKFEKINEITNKINLHLSDGFLKYDTEYQDLLNTEKTLNDRKRELQILLEKKNKEYQEKQGKIDIKVQQKIEEYRNVLDQIDHQKLIICEEIKKKGNFPIVMNLTESSISDCSKCGNKDDNVKKLFCQNCRKKYCENKCVNVCKGATCSSNNVIVCPSCSIACGLCRKYSYCDNCKKKCFYNQCPNKFCAECYKKNEHQARNQNINCKFFTCEVDGKCDCLMTSLFCNKCEKRMCSNCSSKHTQHFPFLENK